MSATYEYVHNSYGMGGEGIVFLILAYVSSCDEHLFSPPFASSYLEYKKIMHYDD